MLMKFFKLFLCIGCVTLMGLHPTVYAETARARHTPQKSSVPKAETAKINSADSEDGYVAASSTHIDFTETSIDGKMKAPDGFMLQGRQGNSLRQMVKLRSNFRNELNNSKSATKALVK
jgi:hypothetical protein